MDDFDFRNLEETYGVSHETEELMYYYIGKYLDEQKERALDDITNYIKQHEMWGV